MKLFARACALMAPVVALAGCSSDDGTNPDDETPSVAEITGFGSNPGNLRMLYQPGGTGSAPRPLVVVLHGCAEDAQAPVASGWAALGARWGFDVVFPEQRTSNNAQRCFNWFATMDATRDAGEALSIRQMVDHANSLHPIDANRVFVVGLSAGGAMAAAMTAAYPDVFSGGAFVAGVPFQCALSAIEAFDCLSGNVTNTPTQWGDRVRGASTATRKTNRISIWQGSADAVVDPENAVELMEQWTDVLGLSQIASTTETVDGAERREHRDVAGSLRVEVYSIPSMGHGMPLDPDDGSVGGCGTAGAFRLAVGICAPARIAMFFGLRP